MLDREKTILAINNIMEKNEIKIQELPFLNKINLRLNPNNNQHMSICENILETILPIQSNTYSQNKKVKSIWLSPDEWLVVYDDDDDIFINLKDKLGDIEASVTDISENRTVIRISGKNIFILLSKFLVLDLEKNLSTQTSCVQTLFVKVPVLLLRNNKDNQTPEVDIFVNKSHANYIYNLIIDGTKNLDF